MVDQIQNIGDQRVADVIYTIKRTLSKRLPSDDGNVQEVEKVFNTLNDDLLKTIEDNNERVLSKVTLEDTSRRKK
jgi:hypothetical protein